MPDLIYTSELSIKVDYKRSFYAKFLKPLVRYAEKSYEKYKLPVFIFPHIFTFFSPFLWLVLCMPKIIPNRQ